VRPLDALDALVSRARRVPERQAIARSKARSWDTRRPTLFAEAAANLALRLTGTGVGLEATFRAAQPRRMTSALLNDAPRFS
jgi:hypothetical protein